MSRYVKQPRRESTDEVWLAALIMFGPFALLARWIWRALTWTGEKEDFQR